MNRQRANGNELIKSIVTVFDIVIVNLLLFGFIELASTVTPAFFHENIKTTFLIANFALLVSMQFYSTLIHHRRVSFEKIFARVARLTLLHVGIFIIGMRLIAENGGNFLAFMFLFWGAEFFCIMVSRYFERNLLAQYRKKGGNTRSVLFVGSDPANLMIYNEMMSDSAMGYRVLGYYANNKMKDAPKELQYLGSKQELLNLLEKNEEELNIDDLFCSISHAENDTIIKLIRFCNKHVVHFFYVPRMIGNVKLNFKPEMFGDIPVLTNHYAPLSIPENKFLKRCFDIVVSGIICLCMLPFMPIIALIIKLQSPGPIFFKQARTGINGMTFQCLKFRSMHVNADADMVQATENDPRKFPFGNFMRKTNIDEFPQFLNVLKGDMSIVGPRPHMLHHTEVYSQLIDKYMVRHFCKPGITGYAQVTGFRGETKELWQMEGRVQRDIWYIENWTFWLDIKIILLTAVSLVKPDKNAY